MIRKEQDKILDAKIESNVNQYKVDRLNGEISAFSSGDLNKYNFLTRRDLKYKPNALHKARFEFSPLGQTFSTRLDKTVPNYQKEGAIKLLKNIRDNLAGDNRLNNRPNNRPNNDDNDNNRPNNDDNDNNSPNNDDNDNNRPNNDDNDEELDNKTSDEEEFNGEEEFKKLEELDKRFKSLESLKYLKEKINDNDSDEE